MVDPETWYHSLPKFVKYYGTVCFLLAVIASLELGLNIGYLTLDWGSIIHRLHVWRVLTNFFVLGKFGMGFVFYLYLLTKYVGLLEGHEIYRNKTVDFYFVVAVMAAGLLVAQFLFLPLPVLSHSLIFGLFYYWSKLEMETPLTIMGFMIKAYQLPFAVMIIMILLGDSPIKEIAGLIIGHVFYFVKEIVPDKYGTTYLETPEWFKKFFPNERQEAAWASFGGRGNVAN